MYIFPSGPFYSLEQLSGLFFRENRAAVMAFLASGPKNMGIRKELTTKGIYLSGDVIKLLGNELDNIQLTALGSLTHEGLLRGTAKQFLASIDGLTVLSQHEELNLILSLGPYTIEKRRFS